jgi:hypothetical protein
VYNKGGGERESCILYSIQMNIAIFFNLIFARLQTGLLIRVQTILEVK